MNLWMSRATQKFAAFTCHFITPRWELRSVLLAVDYMPGHTGENIAARTLSTISSFGVPTCKLVSTVHDQASNMVSAGEKISDAVKSHEDLLCAAHRLQLCVTHSLLEQPVSTLLSTARTLVGHFRQSTKATNALRERQKGTEGKPKKLIQDCATR